MQNVTIENYFIKIKKKNKKTLNTSGVRSLESKLRRDSDVTRPKSYRKHTQG